MTTINLTKCFSGFVNRANWFEVSEFCDRTADCEADTYALPAGYTVQNGTVYDPASIECQIDEDLTSGLPYLVSLSGTVADSAPLKPIR